MCIHLKILENTIFYEWDGKICVFMTLLIRVSQKKRHQTFSFDFLKFNTLKNQQTEKCHINVLLYEDSSYNTLIFLILLKISVRNEDAVK